LRDNISQFAKERLQQEQDKLADEVVLNARKNSHVIDSLVKQWEAAFKGVCPCSSIKNILL
jgi:hypothetical protein